MESEGALKKTPYGGSPLNTWLCGPSLVSRAFSAKAGLQLVAHSRLNAEEPARQFGAAEIHHPEEKSKPYSFVTLTALVFAEETSGVCHEKSLL